MKLLSLTIIASLILLFSCKKGDTGPAGPAGPAGPTGAQGPQGIAGNANVMQYTFGSHDYAAGGFGTYSITTTQDTADRCGWFIYLYSSSNSRWYAMPGYGLGGSSIYRLNMGYSSGKMNLYIDKVSGAGETYAQAKVIRIYAGAVLPGGKSAVPLPDMNDYEAVKEYYHLE